MWWRRKSSESNEAEAARRIAELTDSRRVIAQAYEVERRRIERDLHDGAQQYLVAAAMKLGEAQLFPALAKDPGAAQLLRDAATAIQEGLQALRRTIQGIHPQLLAQQGLVAALEEVAATAANRVRIVAPHPLPELSEEVLAVGYFFACEAIGNAAKYAPGAGVSVLLASDRNLLVSVVDSGPGGAGFVPGGGLVGMRERLAAVGGRLELSSPPGGPTKLSATIPLLLARGESGVVLA
ncbi:MAG: histidine kinase [Propionibacteriaceae bacterium]|nr:histidine kinase [Propionibacteriaceae bacterium]